MRFEYKIVTRTASRHRRSEDASYVSMGQKTMFVAAVADGHGPDLQTEHTQELSRLVARMFVQEYKTHPVPAMAFPAVCDSVQRRVEKTFRRIPVGAVATCVAVDEDKLTIAQVGDCVVLKFTPEHERFVRRLTSDHHPNRPDEITRLRPLYKKDSPNGFDPHISDDGATTRIMRFVNGSAKDYLSVSRSFGDPDFRPATINAPEVLSFDHTSADELYAVCSDGGEDTVRLTFRRLFDKKTPMNDSFMQAVEEIATDVMPMRPRDDITIIFFRVLRDSPTS